MTAVAYKMCISIEAGHHRVESLQDIDYFFDRLFVQIRESVERNPCCSDFVVRFKLIRLNEVDGGKELVQRYKENLADDLKGKIRFA